MIQKKHFWLIFSPIIMLSIGILTFLILQYKPLLPDESEYQMAQDAKTFHIPIYNNDPIYGNNNATTTIILFEDYNCTECKKHINYFQDLLKKHSDDIKLVWKNTLLNDSDETKKLAFKYAYCASEQEAFWPFQLFAFENDKSLSPAMLDAIINKLELNPKKIKRCLSSQTTSDYIQRNQISAKWLNIKTLPTIFLNNKQIYSIDDLTRELDNIWENK